MRFWRSPRIDPHIDPLAKLVDARASLGSKQGRSAVHRCIPGSNESLVHPSKRSQLLLMGVSGTVSCRFDTVTQGTPGGRAVVEAAVPAVAPRRAVPPIHDGGVGQPSGR